MGGGVVLTQEGGYQVMLVWSPVNVTVSPDSVHITTYNDQILTIDPVGLGYENELIIARQLLVADHEGHSALGVVEDFSERSLLPLQVEILELHLVQTDGEVDVGEVPDNLYSQEGLCGRPLSGGRPLTLGEENKNIISIDLVNISLLDGTLDSHVGQR